MNGQLSLLNRQRTRTIDILRLRRIVAHFLRDVRGKREFDIAIVLVSATAMAKLNEKYLGHPGPTDVITFDFSQPNLAPLNGEIIVCVDEAILQSRQYGTLWKSELVRYIIHGVLHLLGHNDAKTVDRKRMKRAENRWMRILSHEFDLSYGQGKPTLAK